MEPVRIDLQNFASYREESVDLSGVTCAALTGENGAGKSTLLDAITWALFGQGTKGGARELDNYVTRGENEGRVEVQFRLNGAVYRVVRGRSIARNKSTLEFFVQDGTNWRPLSGKTIAETQAAIEATLRMDYRTFTASSLILQGQADAFTANMTDAERKEALARILGLDLWDRMQERARERVRELKAEMQAVERQQEQLRLTVGEKSHVEAQLAETEEALKRKASDIESLSADVVELEAQVRQKPALEQAFSETMRAIQKQQEALQANQRDTDKARLQLTQAKQQIEAAQTILGRADEIDAAVDMEAEIQKDVVEFDRQAQEYLQLTNQASELERKVAAWDKANEAEVARVEARLAAARSQSGTLNQVPCNDETKAACPLLASATKAAAEVQQLEARLRELNSAANPHVAAWQEAVRARDAIGYDPQAHQAARNAVADVRKTSSLKPQLDAAAARVQELSTRSTDLQETLAALEHTRLEIEAGIEELQGRSRAIASQLEELIPAAQNLDKKRAVLEQARRDEAAWRTEVGRLTSILERIAQAEADLTAAEEKAKTLRDDLTIYEILDQACGKKAGVPALIVENAVPEIERLANDMLSRMAGGRLAVRLDTQTEGKTTGTVQEVLRITVLDGGTERPYQTYSGAERFMTDLALRVALSKFLAHRAGAEIRLFVLDEGLGACDQTNRQAVMEAIQTVAQEFGKTLVITHIAELQDALPQRLVVTKGPDGSKVHVA